MYECFVLYDVEVVTRILSRTSVSFVRSRREGDRRRCASIESLHTVSRLAQTAQHMRAHSGAPSLRLGRVQGGRAEPLSRSAFPSVRERLGPPRPALATQGLGLSLAEFDPVAWTCYVRGLRLRTATTAGAVGQPCVGGSSCRLSR